MIGGVVDIVRVMMDLGPRLCKLVEHTTWSSHDSDNIVRAVVFSLGRTPYIAQLGILPFISDFSIFLPSYSPHHPISPLSPDLRSIPMLSSSVYILLAPHQDNPHSSLDLPGRRSGRGSFTMPFWRTLDVECVRTNTDIPELFVRAHCFSPSTSRLSSYSLFIQPRPLHYSSALGSSTFSFTR
ncbi:hypothetical protein FRC12_024831 [Ceratobasidium sp. 428]|nr:hypothetical protein FRC12_024831 [Ceratobasidium sp. 428]